MKKALLVIGALLLALPVVAQNRSTFAGMANSTNFAYGLGNGPALQVSSGSSSTGSYAITLNLGSTNTGPSGLQFAPFTVATGLLPPITIGSGSTLETVTPSAASCSTPTVYQTCTVTATFSYSHGAGDVVRSGDGGLQEAINYIYSKGGGSVAVDSSWVQLTGVTTGLTVNSFTPVVAPGVSINDVRGGQTVVWLPGATATTIIAVPTTLTATTAAPSATPVGAYGTGTYHLCIAYVDLAGQEGACSADFSEAGLATGSFIFTSPAASAGAVGYTVYISLTSGTYTLAYKVPLTSTICALTTLETVTPACAVANTTYGQSGATATVTAITVNTSPTAINSGVVSTSAITHGNTTARTTYGYIPAGPTTPVGVTASMWPAAATTAAGSAIPNVLGTYNVAPGLMNSIGKKMRVCGYATSSGASTATVLNLSLQWDSFGMNTAGLPVKIADTALTPSSAFAGSVVNTSFCFTVATTVASASATGGSILPINANVAWGNTATGITASAAPLITTAAVGSLNLASEARLHIVYNHTTGSDGAGFTLNGVTIETF